MDEIKKLHQKYLADVRCDVSQHSGWRVRLFDNAENTKFQITSESVRDVFQSLSDNIAKHNLKFIVEKVQNCDSKDVTFKFYPENYPEMVKYSFNNPESR
ncbi:MAG: hypothetical protein ABJI60_11745 [Kangiellaceae bacterium]|jgi:hypothetical protein